MKVPSADSLMINGPADHLTNLDDNSKRNGNKGTKHALAKPLLDNTMKIREDHRDGPPPTIVQNVDGFHDEISGDACMPTPPPTLQDMVRTKLVRTSPNHFVLYHSSADETNPRPIMWGRRKTNAMHFKCRTYAIGRPSNVENCVAQLSAQHAAMYALKWDADDATAAMTMQYKVHSVWKVCQDSPIRQVQIGWSDASLQDEVVLTNRQRPWNFGGRGRLASRKNMQLVRHHAGDEDGNRDVVLQMVKWDTDEYHLDFQSPFDAVTAFAFGLAQMDL